MKIGMLVGAVGLALASAAQADRSATYRPTSQAASDKAALVNAVNSRIKAKALESATNNGDQNGSLVENQFTQSRDAAVGAPGSQRRQEVLENVRAQIRSGAIDADRTLFDAEALGLETLTNDDYGEAPDRPLRIGSSATPRTDTGDILGGPFSFFDGVEDVPGSYQADPNPCDTTFIEFDDGVNPDGISPGASFFYMVVDWADPATICPTFNSAPPDPEIGGDGNQFVLMDGRGSWGQRLEGTFLGWSTTYENLFIPTVDEPIIVNQDFYFPEDPMVPPVEQSTEDDWSPSSGVEGFIITRVSQRGFNLGDPLADPDNISRRPQVLGPRPGSFTIGDFFATPENPASGLDTFVTKTNEWFSVALVLETNRFSIYFRDSGTDGSGAVLVDDPRDLPGLEIGWNEVYPGNDPVNLGSKGGATIWSGYGRAVNEFGQLAPENQVIAGVSTDNIFTIIGPDPEPDEEPDWAAVNYAYDNTFVIGTPLETPPQPKQTIDPKYNDDIELYEGGAALRLQGNTWTDNLSSNAFIDTNSSNNTTPPPGSVGGIRPPEQSIRQTNEFEDSSMRQEFFTGTPVGDQRPFARPGTPLDISATIKLTDFSTVRAMMVDDPAFDLDQEWFLFGATNPDDTVEQTVHIRLPNPLFDENEASAASNRIDDRPPLDGSGNLDLTELVEDNPANFNYPTTLPMPAIGNAITLTLRLFGDGTAQWLVDGNEVVFDTAFLSAEPMLLESLVNLDGDADLEGFVTTMQTMSQVEFWSGNNLGGFFDSINVDDIMVEGEPRVPGVGPVFEIPYCDDFETNYAVGQLLNGQGDTPFIAGVGDQTTDVSLNNSNVLVEDAEPDLPLAQARDWCSYSVQEVIDQFDRKGNLLPNDWDIAAGDVVNAKFEELFTAPPDCPEDLNGDGVVGAQDLADLLGNWGQSGGPADLNNDGGVGAQDLALLLGVWGPCPSGDPIAFTCPDPAVEAGEANLVLTDPAGNLNPCVVSVQLTGSTVNSAGVNDPTDNTFWTCFTRFQDDELFCRYEITELTVEVDPFDDQPFDECPDWQVGDIVAIDQIFAVNPDTGVADCPGVTSAGAGANTRFEIFKDECLLCEGRWTLLGTAPDPNCEAEPGDVIPAAQEALDTDIRGFAFDFAPGVRWNFPAGASGGTNEDGFVQIAANTLDEVKTEAQGTDVSIDPNGDFGVVAGFVNTGAFDPRGDGLFTSTVGNLPTASSSSTDNACLYWDMYITDLNTQTGVSVNGTQAGEQAGTLVTQIDFGGPDISPFFETVSNSFPIPATNIAVRARNPNAGGLGQQPSVFLDTGVAVPVGQWFRTCVCVREDGTWKVGINDSGLPGGPGGPMGDGLGDRPELFDDTLSGADADAQLVADGSIDLGGETFDLISIGSFPNEEPEGCPGENTVLPITDITTMLVQQNFNEDGDGNPQLPPIVWEALAEDAVAPNGTSSGDDDSYCFYRIQFFDAGATPPPVIPVDNATAQAIDEVDNSTGDPGADGIPDRRPLAAEDVVAIKWETTMDFDVQSLDECPEVLPLQEGADVDFEIQDSMGASLGTGEMLLLSDSKDQEGAESIENGVSNADGPGNGSNLGYDAFGIPPFESGMLMGCFVTVPTNAVDEIESRWFVDNIKLQEEAN